MSRQGEERVSERANPGVLVVVLLGVSFGACYVQSPEEGPGLSSWEQPIDLNSCEGADVPCLPPPDDCGGPDSSGWSNKPRPPGAGPCPAPPSPAGCTQYVIGRQKDVEKYINCPGYHVLNRDDYDQHPGLNDLFIACGACGANSTCPNKFLIASPDEDIPDWSKDGGPWSSTELCQLNKYCKVVTNSGSTGYVKDCNCAAMANDCGPSPSPTPSPTPSPSPSTSPSPY
jgi:hypothetical protein